MGKVSDKNFEIKSKTNSYFFGIYTLDTDFKETYGGVYIFTKRTKKEDGTFQHYVIYIGKTKKFNQRFDSHERWNDIKSHNANCICVLKTNSEDESLAIEKDILLNNKTPLNDQHNK